MYEYNSQVNWIGDRRTKIVANNIELEVDSPKEFGGPDNQLSPENLFPSILASCLLTTFLEFKDRMNIDLQKWESRVHATLGPSPEKGFRFESIEVHVMMKVREEDREKIPRAMELAEKYCFISRAIRNNVKEIVDYEFID